MPGVPGARSTISEDLRIARAVQGHARQGSLGQKVPLRIHHHPGAVQVKACFGQHSLPVPRYRRTISRGR